MPSSSTLLALALAATTPSSTTANPLKTFSTAHSHKHEALASPSQKETKWLVFPQQQELHVQSVEEGSPDTTHDLVSPTSFFKDHASALGLDDHSQFTMKREYATNGGAITHQKYQQFVNNVLVYGGDFHLTVGSHDGGM